MADTQYDQFLREATAFDCPADPAPGRECLYGVYTSWCFLSRTMPQPENAFSAAMKKKHIRPGRTQLRIKGPAAADYIMSTYPGMVSAS